MTKRGPYVSEDGPEVYLPVSDYTLNEARHEAAQFAQDTIGGWGRARYLGKGNNRLHDHDEPWDKDDCAFEAVWTFETYEGTYR
jgi:hypothetical protein